MKVLESFSDASWKASKKTSIKKPFGIIYLEGTQNGLSIWFQRLFPETPRSMYRYTQFLKESWFWWKTLRNPYIFKNPSRNPYCDFKDPSWTFYFILFARSQAHSLQDATTQVFEIVFIHGPYSSRVPLEYLREVSGWSQSLMINFYDRPYTGSFFTSREANPDASRTLQEPLSISRKT